MLIDSIENKRKILAKFLEIAAFEGWKEEALRQAFASLEIDFKFSNLIFENGILSVIDFYIDEQNHKLNQITAQNADFYGLKVRQKIQFCLYKLFENDVANRVALARLRNFYLDFHNFSNFKNGPKPLLTALKHAAKIADNIWILSGDSATDFNYYTKRLTLAKIILKSFMVFVKEENVALPKTKETINQEIEKVMQFEKIKLKIKNVACDIKQKSHEIFTDEKGQFKGVKRIIKDLPFIRLFN